MLSEKLYGWYSLNAYNAGESEYIYVNDKGQETHCTITSYDKRCPYPPSHHLYNDVVFMGEVHNLL